MLLKTLCYLVLQSSMHLVETRHAADCRGEMCFIFVLYKKKKTWSEKIKRALVLNVSCSEALDYGLTHPLALTTSLPLFSYTSVATKG